MKRTSYVKRPEYVMVKRKDAVRCEIEYTVLHISTHLNSINVLIGV